MTDYNIPIFQKRQRDEVIADILHLGRFTRGRMMVGAGLSNTQGHEYLKFLLDRGCLEPIGISKNGQVLIYRVTPKGKELREIIDRILQKLSQE